MSAEPVSVLIPTVGRVELLRACLASVTGGGRQPDEVLVVDQSGGHEVEALARELGDAGVRAVPCEGRGIARAMNLGLGLARHDAVLVTHDDCTVAADWVQAGARLAAAAPEMVITGQVRPAGDDPDAVPSCRTDPDPRDFSSPGDYGQLYPASMVLPRRAAQAVGFDERFITAAEDLDFAYRWLRGGGTIRYAPELVVDHHDWRGPDELDALERRYTRARGAFYAKHLLARDRGVLGHLRWELKGSGDSFSGRRRALLAGLAAGARRSAP